MSYNDSCNGGCPRPELITTLESERMKYYRDNSDFMDFVELINEWDSDSEMHESYIDGLSQLLEESSINPEKQALLLVEYLYESDKLKEIISDFKNIKK